MLECSIARAHRLFETCSRDRRCMGRWYDVRHGREIGQSGVSKVRTGKRVPLG